MGGRKGLEDFILTLSDGDEEDVKADEIELASAKKRKRASTTKSHGKRQKVRLSDGSDAESIGSDMASDFEFQLDGDLQDLQNFDTWESDITQLSGNEEGVGIDETITKPKDVVGTYPGDTKRTNIHTSQLWSHDSTYQDGDMSPPADHQEIPQDSETENSSSENEEERARAAAFFAPADKGDDNHNIQSFLSMHLARPILRGLSDMQFSKPTPIQAKTIPIALLGKDIVGSAVTGSGKTAAFMIPILDRLVYRSKKFPTSRVAILLPTRELAEQCFSVGKQLAKYTDIEFCLLVGGLSLHEQKQVLRRRPDILVATPGRFIDHMRNTEGFTADTLEILVLDEADRMLEDGFAEEINEILTTISRSRQTMLFSATMDTNVDRLIQVGLQSPVRISVDAKNNTVTTLRQEFLRLRPGREHKRLAHLLHLCKDIFTDRCIIFFNGKKELHRIRVIFTRFGFKAAELHGDMSQEERLTSVKKFRAGTVSHLLATNVAARGLDIRGVESVINYEAPRTHQIYLHRIGRTARAGQLGVSCTLTTEADRKVTKAAVRSGKAQGVKIVSRTVEAHFVEGWEQKLDGIDDEVDDILRQEKELKELASAEMQVQKGQNMMDHEDEIMSAPRRTWFQSEKDKKAAKQNDLGQLNRTVSKKFKRKLSGKEKKKLTASKERAAGLVGKKKTKAQRGLSRVKPTKK